jgi:hypothetical protein
MRQGRLNFALGLVLAAVLAGAIAAQPASGQSSLVKTPALRAVGGPPPKWVENMRSMRPEGQGRFVLVAMPASAQNGRFRAAFVQQRRAAAAAQRQAQRQAEKPAPKPNANGAVKPPNIRTLDGLPPKWVESMRDMTPEEQQRFMQNDARFTNLPPARQEQIRRNLEDWNKRTPEEQQQIRQREAALERMTPQQRQYFTQVVGPKYQALPQPRKQVINRHLAMLQQMSPETQQAALNDPRFMQAMSPDEQQLLRDLNSLRNPPTQ